MVSSPIYFPNAMDADVDACLVFVNANNGDKNHC